MRQSRAEEKILGGREGNVHALQWEMHRNQEGNNPLGIVGHSGEAVSQEEDGRTRGVLHQD